MHPDAPVSGITYRPDFLQPAHVQHDPVGESRDGVFIRRFVETSAPTDPKWLADQIAMLHRVASRGDATKLLEEMEAASSGDGAKPSYSLHGGG